MVPAPETLIVALATPPGRGALALVRLSGAGALDVAARLARRETFQPRVATLARLHLPEGLVEAAVVTAFTAPHSFTGQDCLEISTHGSPVIVDAVLRACLDAGARLARPGEFTWRAYLNGRLDLLQAEAVADLVAATTSAQVRVASAHLDGTLSLAIREMGDEIARLRALLEASLDFPDEGFHFIAPSEVVSRIGDLRAVCDRLLGSAAAGKRLHDGARVVIAGRPNAGKSSLFNALLKRQRAIVTPVAGTTRDLLTETTRLRGRAGDAGGHGRPPRGARRDRARGRVEGRGEPGVGRPGAPGGRRRARPPRIWTSRRDCGRRWRVASGCA